jgi:Protein of unknown function (DUF973)
MPYSPQMSWGPPPVPPSDSRDTDLAALSKIWTAALISVVGSALGVVALVLTTTGYFRFVIPRSGSALPFAVTALYIVLGLALVGIAVSVVSFWFYRDGFLAVRRVDARFSSSPTWALLVIIAAILLALGLVALFASLIATVSCVGTATTIPVSCVNLGGLLGGLGLFLIAIIVGFIGIVGTLVAIWRLGDRYNDSLFKIGAVLLIIPYASFVGQILILVAASKAQTTVRQWPGTGFAAAPSVMSPPPPPPY